MSVDCIGGPYEGPSIHKTTTEIANPRDTEVVLKGMARVSEILADVDTYVYEIETKLFGHRDEDGCAGPATPVPEGFFPTAQDGLQSLGNRLAALRSRMISISERV